MPAASLSSIALPSRTRPRRLASAVLSVLLAAVLLSACGGGGSGTAADTPKKAATSAPTVASACPTTLSHVHDAATAATQHDERDFGLDDSRLVFVGRTDAAESGGWVYQIVHSEDGSITGPQPLGPTQYDNGSVFAVASGKPGTVVLTEAMNAKYDGHSVLVTFIDADGNIAWEGSAQDGSTKDADGGESLNVDRISATVVGDTVYVDTAAGMQAFAAADGSKATVPQFLSGRALFPSIRQPRDRFVTSNLQDAKNPADVPASLEVLNADGDQIPGRPVVFGSDGSYVTSDGSAAKLFSPSGASTDVPKTLDNADQLAVCGTHVYALQGSKINVYTPPSSSVVASFALPSDVDPEEVTLGATADSVVVISAPEGEDGPVRVFAVS